jgi:glycine cleavage system transcriptional repressor
MTQGQLVAVTVVGVDRPGIVAAISKVLFERGCNLEDVSSTILRGHFSMMLVVSAPADIDAPALEDELLAAGRDLGLMVTVRPVEEASSVMPDPTHIISVYGADRPGIVFKLAQALAAAGVNITDLTSRVIGDADEPVYAVMVEVELPQGLQADDLLRLKDELDLEVSIHPVDADVL